MAVEFEPGNYVVQNVKTGQYLRFSRPDDTTNVHGHSDYGTVWLEQDSSYGQSGKLWQTWSGTVVSDMGKCGSAQWSELGYDIGFVSYACKVGKSGHLGTDSLEVAKQFWRVVPCGNQGQDDDEEEDDEAQDSTRPDIKLNVVKSGSKGSDGVEFSGKNDDNTKQQPEQAPKPKPTPAPKPAKGNNKYGGWVPQTTKSVNPYDRTTWVCRHPGYWLHRHPAYVTKAGHVECKDDLESYRSSLKFKRTLSTQQNNHRMKLRHVRKRSSSSGPLFSTFSKRAPSSGRFCLLAEDHMVDMKTRAVGSQQIETFGGYQSQELVEWNEHDKAQQWDIYAV
ncbi:hypothetical protein OIO90_003251 [Microbotryomycetes sp. JL221]|nr:hypothetical protein OIO90_003251 [Microbotryomycetes sp. JL221]